MQGRTKQQNGRKDPEALKYATANKGGSPMINGRRSNLPLVQLPTSLHMTVGGGQTTPPDLGEGWDPILLEFTTNTALEPITPATTQKTGTAFGLYFAFNRQDLETYTSFAVEAEAAYLGAKVYGAGEILAKTKYTGTSIYCVATVTVSQQTSSVPLSGPALTTAALDKLKASTQDFYDVFGGYYVSSVVTGATLYIVFELSYKTIELKVEAETELAKYNKFSSASANFKAGIEAAQESAQMSFNLMTVGGPTVSPELSIDDLIKAAIAFPKGVTAENASPMLVELSGYWKIPSIPTNTLQQLLSTPVSNVQAIAALIEEYDYVLTQMSSALDFANSELSEGDSENLEKWVTEIGSDISLLKTTFADTSPPTSMPNPDTLTFGNTPKEYQALVDDLNISDLVQIKSSKSQFHLRNWVLQSKKDNHIGSSVSVYNAHYVAHEWYPKIENASSAQNLYLTIHKGESGDTVKDGDLVYLKTTESKVGHYDRLASMETEDCFYEDETTEKQRWKISKAEGPGNQDDIIRYGDAVQFTNENDSNVLRSDDDYPWLTSSTTTHFHWLIEKSS